jgi:Tubulin-tyrosine ligase family
VIVDDNLKPWLLEVNASPSLTANTKEDYMLKTEMLHGMLDVVDMEVSIAQHFYDHRIFDQPFCRWFCAFCFN